MRGEFRALEEARGATVEVEEQVVVDPLKIEQNRERLAHAHISEHRPPSIEHEIVARLGQSGRKRLPDDAAVAQCGKVIARLPARRIALGTHVEQATLERLMMGAGVAVVIEADLIEIPKTSVDGEIASPIVVVTHEREAPPGL